MENNENAIDFRLSDVQEEDKEDISKPNLIQSLQLQADKDIFPKKNNWRIVWLLWYCTQKVKN